MTDTLTKVFGDMKFHQTINQGHGGLEIRKCWSLRDPQAFERLRHHEGWVGLQSIVMVKRQHETANFISNYLPMRRIYWRPFARTEPLRIGVIW